MPGKAEVSWRIEGSLLLAGADHGFKRRVGSVICIGGEQLTTYILYVNIKHNLHRTKRILGRK